MELIVIPVSLKNNLVVRVVLNRKERYFGENVTYTNEQRTKDLVIVENVENCLVKTWLNL